MSQCSVNRYFVSYGRDMGDICQCAGKDDPLQEKKILALGLRTLAITLVVSSIFVLIAAIACVATVSAAGFISAVVLLGLIPFIWVAGHEIYVIGHNISAVVKEREIVLFPGRGGFNVIKDRIEDAGGVRKIAQEAWKRGVKNENPYVVNTWIVRHFVPKSKRT